MQILTYYRTEHRMLRQSAEISQQLLGLRDSYQDDAEELTCDICGIITIIFQLHKTTTTKKTCKSLLSTPNFGKDYRIGTLNYNWSMPRMRHRHSARPVYR